MMGAESDNVKMRRISRKLSEHFAFLNSDWATLDSFKITRLHCI